MKVFAWEGKLLCKNKQVDWAIKIKLLGILIEVSLLLAL